MSYSYPCTTSRAGDLQLPELIPLLATTMNELEPGSGAGPAFQRDDERRGAPMASDWPLRSCLELAALPGAVPCARLHARQVLWEWGHGAVAESAELLVSEIVTNAVRASSGPPSGRPDGATAGRVPTVRFWLAADRHRVLIQVWICRPRSPVAARVDRTQGVLRDVRLGDRNRWRGASQAGIPLADTGSPMISSDSAMSSASAGVAAAIASLPLWAAKASSSA